MKYFSDFIAWHLARVAIWPNGSHLGDDTFKSDRTGGWMASWNGSSISGYGGTGWVAEGDEDLPRYKGEDDDDI